jgi:hypothetical protein
MTDPERIKEAAMMFRGIMYTGRSHALIMNDIRVATGVLKILQRDAEFGFVTTTGRFVDRKEAAKIALACGQIERLRYQPDELYSEELP